MDRSSTSNRMGVWTVRLAIFLLIAAPLLLLLADLSFAYAELHSQLCPTLQKNVSCQILVFSLMQYERKPWVSHSVTVAFKYWRASKDNRLYSCDNHGKSFFCINLKSRHSLRMSYSKQYFRYVSSAWSIGFHHLSNFQKIFEIFPSTSPTTFPAAKLVSCMSLLQIQLKALEQKLDNFGGTIDDAEVIDALNDLRSHQRAMFNERECHHHSRGVHVRFSFSDNVVHIFLLCTFIPLSWNGYFAAIITHLLFSAQLFGFQIFVAESI